MFYLIVLFTLFCFSQINLKNNRLLYSVIFFIISFFFAVRYGQGTDYYSYKDMFIYNWAYKGVEPFYSGLNCLITIMGGNFSVVIFVSTFIMMCFFYKTLSKYSKNPIMGLFLLYANYIVYLTSAIRQGIAISITTYAIVDYIYKKRQVKFYLLCIFAMLFHRSAVLCIIIPVLLKYRSLLDLTNTNNFILLSSISIVLGLILFPILGIIVPFINPKYAAYVTTEYSNIFSQFASDGVRIISSYLALYSYKCYKAKLNEYDSDLLWLYLFGSLVLFILSATNQASRATDYFTILEIIIFSNIFTVLKKKKTSIVFWSIIALFVFLFMKDLRSFEIQGDYYSKNPFKYPYVSIFSKEKILRYRGDIKNMDIHFLFD